MKFTNPSPSNRTAIENCLKETLPNRREWISNQGPTISEIFNEYPRLLDYNGDMVMIFFLLIFLGIEIV